MSEMVNAEGLDKFAYKYKKKRHIYITLVS